VRLAVSVPEGHWIAVLLPPRKGAAEGAVVMRQVARISGQGGSHVGTGEWLPGEELARLSWRPA
jgi:uncharacterized protein (DUF2126 family)